MTSPGTIAFTYLERLYEHHLDLIGIAGSFIASYLGRAMGWYRLGESAGFIAAVLGSIILLFVYRLIAGRR